MIKQIGKIRTLIFVCCLLSTCSLLFAQRNTLPNTGFFQVREGIPNARLQITKGAATVAFLGGSITHNPGWRDSVCQYLQTKFSQTTFHFINAGIPSLGSLPDAFRVQQDVLDSGKIDLLFVEAAVNDRVNNTDSITQVRSLEGIVRHARKSNPRVDIILMSFAGPEKLKDYEKGKVPVEVRNHEMVASHYNLPSINLAKEVYNRIKAREFSWKEDFKDVHPSPFGQKIYSNTIKELLEKCFSKSVDKTDEILYPIPTPLDKWNFENGKYIPIQKAHLQSGFKLVENWQPEGKIQTREGFVNRPMLEATTPGASLSLSFKGTAIGMAIISGPDAGEIDYSIDGKVYQSIDLFTQWSSYLHLPWYVLFDGALENKKHTLKVRIAKDKNSASKGTACRIVYFLVNE
jgi:sialidase-1